VRLLNFLPIKIDHLCSNIQVLRGLFLLKISFKWILSHETTINRGTLSSFDINSSRVEALSKLHYKPLKNTCRFDSKFIFDEHSNIQRTIEDYLFKSFFQTSKFYWNQAPKPPKSSRTLINQIHRFKPKAMKNFNTHNPSNTKNIRKTQRTQRTKNFETSQSLEVRLQVFHQLISIRE
jgi:hypothetical protein